MSKANGNAVDILTKQVKASGQLKSFGLSPRKEARAARRSARVLAEYPHLMIHPDRR